jgi:hypothetical protein
VAKFAGAKKLVDFEWTLRQDDTLLGAMTTSAAATMLPPALCSLKIPVLPLAQRGAP